MIGHRDVASDLKAMLEHEIVLGFSDDERIVEDALEAFPDQGEPAVRAALAAALAARANVERAWPATTDCDRLDAAFAALEAEGVVARPNFWCCTSCACSAIHDEMIDEEARGTAVRGYVLFHAGTLENAVAGHPLGLQCGGSIADGDAAEAQVAERVAHAVKRAGLAVQWDGGRVVEVTIDWKRRRRPARAEDPRSVETQLAAWEKAFAAACRYSVPSGRPAEVGPTLALAGAGELAVRWAARSGSCEAAGRTAQILSALKDEARARELLLMAYRRYPAVERRFDNRLTAELTREPAFGYIELLLRCGLADDAVARAATTRVTRLPPSLYAAAAKAWLACEMREAGRAISPRDEDRWIGEARYMWKHDKESPLDLYGAGDARVALAAALWSYLPAEEAEEYADTAFDWLDAEAAEWPSPVARMAAFRAAADNGDAASLVAEVSGTAALELLEEMVAVSEDEAARPLLEKLPGVQKTLGRIALGEPPARDAAATREALARIQSDYEEGLFTRHEHERAQVIEVYALAASGAGAAAAALLAPSLEERVAEEREPVLAARARLEEAAAAGFAIDWAASAPAVEAWTPAAEKRLARTLEQLGALQEGSGYEAQSKLRSAAAALVKLSASDRARSSKILDDLMQRWPVEEWRARCVEALLAAGRLDEALRLDRSKPAWRCEPRVSLELARRLLLEGRAADALERASAGMDAASIYVLPETGLLLLTLSAPDRRPAVAARLREAFDRGLAALAELSTAALESSALEDPDT